MSSLPEALAAIDVTPLDKLGKLSAEIGVLQERLSAMEERRSSVAEAVFTRVRSDYLDRQKHLEEEAAPLKQAARDEFSKLSKLLQQSEADHETVRLQREEVEFRHALGEFDDKEFKKQLGEIDATLKERAAALDQAQEIKKRFVDAFGSEESLVSAEAAAPAAPGPAQTPAPPQQEEAVPPSMVTGEMPAVPHSGEASPYDTLPPPVPKPAMETIPPPSNPAVAATRKLNPITDAQLAAAATPPPPSSTDVGSTQTMRVLKGNASAAPRPDQTVIIRGARLVPQNPAAGKITHSIGLKPASIGSSEDCDVRVAGASAQHAEIRVSMAGYTLSDLGGGVRINGVAVEQHLLRHEDVLDIGPAKFVFKEG